MRFVCRRELTILAVLIGTISSWAHDRPVDCLAQTSHRPTGTDYEKGVRVGAECDLARFIGEPFGHPFELGVA